MCTVEVFEASVQIQEWMHGADFSSVHCQLTASVSLATLTGKRGFVIGHCNRDHETSSKRERLERFTT